MKKLSPLDPIGWVVNPAQPEGIPLRRVDDESLDQDALQRTSRGHPRRRFDRPGTDSEEGVCTRSVSAGFVSPVSDHRFTDVLAQTRPEVGIVPECPTQSDGVAVGRTQAEGPNPSIWAIPWTYVLKLASRTFEGQGAGGARLTGPGHPQGHDSDNVPLVRADDQAPEPSSGDDLDQYRPMQESLLKAIPMLHDAPLGPRHRHDPIDHWWVRWYFHHRPRSYPEESQGIRTLGESVQGEIRA
ncbi:hypothetical protein ElP_52390 [Tautonia plasticadhaerens]|uniref:Uncharacterized protein n=1 Tax=Tautonia plasticadhaerens TaxID=2527974 RepID=A0A518H8Y5_9BACT|nr:hypothetical protein ElP_52390 [Tautonia plasticadhaerens]